MVYGLYLEGARWDRQRRQLGESLPKMLIDPLPCMHLVPMKKDQKQGKGKYVR